MPLTGGLITALNVIGGKWKVPILHELRAASRRFGELRRLIVGVSEKVLIQQLRELEADGVVDREIYAETPPRVEYSLTPYGVSLSDALAPLGDWGDQHMRRAAPPHPIDPPADPMQRRRSYPQVAPRGNQGLAWQGGPARWQGTRSWRDLPNA